MASQIEILLKARDEMTAVMDKAVKEMRELGVEAERTDKKMKGASQGAQGFAQTAERLDATGRNARIGLSAAAQAADVFGLNLSGTLGPLANVADGVGDVAGSLQNLMQGMSRVDMLATGVIGVLIVAFAALNSIMEKRNQEIAEGILKNDAWVASVRKEAAAYSETTGMLKEYAEAKARATTGWSFEAGDIVEQLASQNAAILSSIVALRQFGIVINDLSPGLESSAEKAQRLHDQLDAVAWSARSGYDALENLRAAHDANAVAVAQHAAQLEAAQRAVENFSAGEISVEQALATVRSQFALSAVDIGKYTEQILLAYEATAEFQAILREAEGTTDSWAVHLGAAGNSIKAVADINKRGAEVEKSLWQERANAAKQYQQQIAAAAKQFLSSIRQIVEGVLTIPSVEERLQRAGDSWAEFELRLRAKLTGTNTALRAWGPEFEETLKQVQERTGLTLEQIEKKFGDFSLFADKGLLKIPGLIDWDSLVGDTAEAVNKIIGKYNLVMAGVDAYLSSPEAAAQLPDLAKALGINVGEIDTAALQEKVRGALGSALGAISGPGVAGGLSDTALQGLTGGLNTAATKAGDLARTITTSLNTGLAELKNKIDPLIPSLQGAGDTLTKSTNPAFAALDATTKTIRTTLDAIQKGVENDMKAFDTWVAVIPSYETTITNLITNALDPLRNALSGIVSELESIINKANEAAAALAAMNGSGSGGASGGTPTNTNAPVGQKEGGSGVLKHNTLFYAHAGEAYWFSGVPMNVPPPTPPGRGGANIAPVFDFRGATFIGANAAVIQQIQNALERMWAQRMQRLAIDVVNLDAGSY